MANSQQEQIERITASYNEASHKLDYFILGVTLAICAYLAQTNPYGQFGPNKETFLLCSLLVFAASAVCGFKRIENTISIMGHNTYWVQQLDEDSRKNLKRKIADDNASGGRYYRFRNYLLFAGLLCYLAAKVWATYQNNGWIPVH